MRLITLLMVACIFMIVVLAHDEDASALPPTAKQIREAIERNANVQRSCKRSACVLTQELINGPYYVELYNLVRYNITEGYAGIPLVLNIHVIDVATCLPVPNATIDIWHANAVGVYSHINVNGNLGGANTTFLRGLQMTDSNGLAAMATVIAGWYEGRAVHTHIKVHYNGTANGSTYSGGQVVHTGQLFFNQSFMDEYATVSPYSSNTQSRTSLVDDMWYPYGGSAALFEVSLINSTAGISGGVIATATVAINTTFLSDGETDQLTNYTASGSGGATAGPPTGATSPPTGALGGMSSTSSSSSTGSATSTSGSTTGDTSSTTDQSTQDESSGIQFACAPMFFVLLLICEAAIF